MNDDLKESGSTYGLFNTVPHIFLWPRESLKGNSSLEGRNLKYCTKTALVTIQRPNLVNFLNAKKLIFSKLYSNSENYRHYYLPPIRHSQK